MTGSFDTITYFADLFALALLIVPLYYALPRQWARRTLMTIVGAYLIYAIAPRLLVFYAIFWTLVWVLHRLITRSTEKPGENIVFTLSIVATLAPMVLWKLFPYEAVVRFNLDTHLLVTLFSRRLQEIDNIRNIIIPIGLSFATFRGVDFLVQTYLGIIGPVKPGKLFYYGFFPPIQVIGPIAEYSEVNADDKVIRWDSGNMGAGLAKIATGLLKIYVLAFPLQESAAIFSAPFQPAWKVWASLLGFAWYFYFNFAGYSDIAIGSARLLGIRLNPNFNFPYLQPNPQAFWGAWHMSLTRFAQRNIFVPLGGYRRGSQYLAMFATMMVIALWHDLSLSLVIFGFYHATGVCANRWWSDKRGGVPQSAPPVRVLATVLTFLFVMLSFPLIMMPIENLAAFYSSLLGMGL